MTDFKKEFFLPLKSCIFSFAVSRTLLPIFVSSSLPWLMVA